MTIAFSFRRHFNELRKSNFYSKANFESGYYPMLPFVNRLFALRWAHFGHKELLELFLYFETGDFSFSLLILELANLKIK